MDNKEGNMENDLNSLGEAERVFEVNRETAQNLGKEAVKRVGIDEKIEEADRRIQNIIGTGDPNTANEVLAEERQEIQEEV